MSLTATVVAAFAVSEQDSLLLYSNEHTEAAHSAAEWAGEWLARACPGGEPLGFTCHASFGGGAGWDTEAGVTFVFANLGAGQLALAQDFARALKSRESQEAVVFLVREEQFSLV